MFIIQKIYEIMLNSIDLFENIVGSDCKDLQNTKKSKTNFRRTAISIKNFLFVYPCMCN